MAVTIKEVATKSDLRKFICLPAEIHKNHKNWVPPLYIDERAFYNPKKNRSFSHCECTLALAFKDNKVAGRIMGIINHKYNQHHNEKTGRFFNIECFDDSETANALLEFVENWAINKGMDKLAGPLGFSDKDPQGMLIEGFDMPMVITTNCNYQYMVRLIEEFGFGKKVDLVDYRMKIPEKIPAFYEEIKNRCISRNNIRLLEFKSKKELKPYIRKVFELVNETYGHIFAFSEIEQDEMEYMAKRYLPVINPRFVKMVLDNNGILIAFVLAIPDIAEGIRLAGGKLLPLGIFKILRSVRSTKMLVMLLGAIKHEYRNAGLDALMGVSMLQEAQKAGMEVIDSHLVLEDNNKMRAEYERMGGEVYKRYRIFQKEIN
ncbi:MAG: hypothetical protein R6W78_04925 [Bacteroidales bacterium]